LLLFSALLWSLGGLLIKLVDWNPMAIAGTRAIIAAFTIAVCYRGRLRFTWSRWQIGGAVAYASTTIFFVLATKLTTAANAILLQYTAPIYIALLAPWVLGEPSRRRDWVIIAITLAGMGLFFFDDLNLSGLWGNLAAITSGVSFAGITLFLRKQKDGSPVESIVLGNLIAAAVGLAFVRTPFPGATGWAALLALGVVQLGVSYIFYARAIRRATAMQATLVQMLEPILNPIWVLLVIGEMPGTFALMGGAIVVGAVTLSAVLAIRERPPKSPPRRGAFPVAPS
jgi:drug/metabolite transporter (DMT)-like permease